MELQCRIVRAGCCMQLGIRDFPRAVISGIGNFWCALRVRAFKLNLRIWEHQGFLCCEAKVGTTRVSTASHDKERGTGWQLVEDLCIFCVSSVMTNPLINDKIFFSPIDRPRRRKRKMMMMMMIFFYTRSYSFHKNGQKLFTSLPGKKFNKKLG